jgi:hypothetical protein
MNLAKIKLVVMYSQSIIILISTGENTLTAKSIATACHLDKNVKFFEG